MQTENAERVVLLTQMFDSYGQTPTGSRIASYIEVVGHLPIEALREGIRDAQREVGDYPPGPGTIRRHTLAVARMRPGDPSPLFAAPNTTPRLGSGSVGDVMAGLEGRVERNYRRVIERAKEIQRERRLPASLDSRLWSLGEAERELDFREAACACQPRCRADFWASLEEQRRQAGVRCGAIR